MKIYSVYDKEFSVYGRVLSELDTKELVEAMQKTPLPEEVVYVPSDKALEELSVCRVMSESVYGGMPVQTGYCNGHNSRLNALEYHRSSEINVAATDMILMLGRQQDIREDFTYETDRVEAFLVPENTAVEIYATTLHYAPCQADSKGFRCAVILPQGTNYEVKQPGLRSEDRLLAASNKWLIAHKDAHIEGAFEGLVGENITL